MRMNFITKHFKLNNMTLEDRIKSLDNRDRALLMDCITMLHSCELIEDARTRIGISDEYRLQSLHEAINTFYENIGKGYPSVGFKPNAHINWQPFDPDNPPKTKQIEILENGYEESEWMLLSFYDLFEIEDCIGVITKQNGECGWYAKDSLGHNKSIDTIKAYAIINPSNL